MFQAAIIMTAQTKTSLIIESVNWVSLGNVQIPRIKRKTIKSPIKKNGNQLKRLTDFMINTPSF
jgi:hypothetical protein